MPMATYLIDYENTEKYGLAGVEQLNNTDNLVIFLGVLSKISPELICACVNHSKARIEFRKCSKTAKNYLDFQLSTHLGFLVATTDEKQYCIVSKDKGFAAVIAYWQRENTTLHFNRQPSICPGRALVEMTTVNKKGTPPSEWIRKEIRPVLKTYGMRGPKYRMVYSIFARSRDLISLHGNLTKKFGFPIGTEIYKQLRSAYHLYLNE
jgi:hypothetical protein